MKTISKKITVYIFVCLLVFCTTSTTFYRSVHAMEWVGGALAFEEALKWTLAVLGITATTGLTDAYWDEYGDEFVDYAIQDGATQAEVAEWQLKLCEGVLDKGSSVWASFKEWAKTLISSSSGGSGDVVLSSPCSLPALMDFIWSEKGLSGNYSVNSDFSNLEIYGFTCDVPAWDSSSFYMHIYVGTPVSLSINSISNGNFSYRIESLDGTRFDTYNFKGNANINSLGNASSGNNLSSSYNLSDNFASFLGGASSLINSNYLDGFSNASLLTLGEGSGDDVTDGNFQGLDGVDTTNLDVISSDLPDEADPEVSLPYPGLDTSDDSISSDTYDDIINAINDGDLPIEDGIEDILAMLKVISYDTTTDDVIPPRPDPDDPTENVKKDDVINENKSNMGFTLAGLENVFPFCIPWDIYAFMTLLVADPVAPEFDFPIKSVNNQTENIHVDLSPFEPVAVVVRYIFDFLFIIGLAMLTRSLIGGGSSD